MKFQEIAPIENVTKTISGNTIPSRQEKHRKDCSGSSRPTRRKVVVLQKQTTGLQQQRATQRDRNNNNYSLEYIVFAQEFIAAPASRDPPRPV